MDGLNQIVFTEHIRLAPETEEECSTICSINFYLR